MAYKGRDPVRNKTIIDNKIVGQVNSFHYLRNCMSCKYEMDINNKFNNYLKITGIINNVFRPQKTFKENKNKTI